MMLEIRKLLKKFDGKDKFILSNIDLVLSTGEVIGLVGSSGSGKTTLLRILAGLEEPSAGAVIFRGEAVKGPSEQLVAGHPSIRLVHQHFELAHRLSVYENVAQKLRNLHPEEQRERTMELLEVCRLSQLAGSMVEQLSGGEKQRLSLARTLAEEPELLLLDEPFSNLDPSLREEIKETLFRYIRQQGIAAVIVSHDPKDALSLADRLWVLQKGTVVQQGSPEEVYRRPLSPEVAGLFGKINLLSREELSGILEDEARNHLQKVPEDCMIGIRPEIIQLAGAEEAQLEAVVQEIWFFGNYMEAEADAKGGVRLKIHLPFYEEVKVGNQVNLKIRWNRVQFF